MISYMVSYTSNEPTNGGPAVKELLDEGKSIYIQIQEMIETDILRGVLREDERIPSTNELAKLYIINPATAAKGVNLLVDSGILFKKRGIGMFVAPGAAEKIRAQRKKAFMEEKISELLSEAKSLGISKEELIEMIRNGGTKQ